ncbi:YdcF family protein [Blastomonas sp. AAP53]|uniref:YdcF family protein n=1 Tax=Blastomonas sp. AAP53 TaxID=1248760 RepID=UPI001266F03C|nr:YdcF family protein [Blastomonas sp. AAP53]
MKRSMRPLIALLAALALPGAAQAMDPPGYTAPFDDTLEALNFPLLSLLRTAPGWGDALRSDPALITLAAQRAERVRAATACTARPACLADAWAWTPADIATVEGALRRIAAEPGRAQALVTRHMRPSGRFARHEALADPELVVAAWTDAAAGMNNLIAVYAQGTPPRYPLIDATIFDTKEEPFGAVLDAHGQVTAAGTRADDLVFDAPGRYAIGLLRMNERTDAAAYRQQLAQANAAAAALAVSTRWADYRYPALLVFGHGPEDAQSRTGVMGHIRMARAADLFAAGLAPFIVVSGGNVHPNRTPFNEAVEMKRILIEQYEIPADRILIEPHARHTTTNLRNCARLLFAAGLPTDRPSLIVTDPATSPYIGSTALMTRTLQETGVTPGQVTAADTAFAFEFLPDRKAFHAEPLDPLDP